MDNADVQRLLGAARDAQRAGRAADAARAYRAVLAAVPDQPIALNALGIQALGEGDWARATDLFMRATAADGLAPELWMNLAKARRLAADDAGERAALESALAVDRRHFMALVRLAELHERRGERPQALERWSGVLAMAPMIDRHTPELAHLFDHARHHVERARADFAETIDGSLAATRDAVPAAARRRFDACIDHMLGRRRIFANECAGMHFPFLPADEFFPRALFPWLPQIEAKTAVIRAELEALLAAGGPGIAPYVAMESGTPENKWSALDHKLDWGACHLWRNGVRDDEACARCPETAAAMAALPLSDLPGRTPTVFFSILQPGVHLPAHTGVSNTRAIIHLPLIVPPGCAFRVGGETREWREGEAFAFDDTIEHEAWNRSDRVRAVLIFDVWNPHIAEPERDLLRAFFRAADGSGQDPRQRVSD